MVNNILKHTEKETTIAFKQALKLWTESDFEADIKQYNPRVKLDIDYTPKTLQYPFRRLSLSGRSNSEDVESMNKENLEVRECHNYSGFIRGIHLYRKRQMQAAKFANNLSENKLSPRDRLYHRGVGHLVRVNDSKAL